MVRSQKQRFFLTLYNIIKENWKLYWLVLMGVWVYVMSMPMPSLSKWALPFYLFILFIYGCLYCVGLLTWTSHGQPLDFLFIIIFELNWNEMKWKGQWESWLFVFEEFHLNSFQHLNFEGSAWLLSVNGLGHKFGVVCFLSLNPKKKKKPSIKSLNTFLFGLKVIVANVNIV